MSSLLSVLQQGARGRAYQFPVIPAELSLARKSVEYERNRRSPHQKYHSLEVELGSEYVHLSAMIHDGVVSVKIFSFEWL